MQRVLRPRRVTRRLRVRRRQHAAMPQKLPTKPAHIRFAVELVNAGVTPYASGSGPLGTGAATLYYDNTDGITTPRCPLATARRISLAETSGGASGRMRGSSDALPPSSC